MKHAQVVWGNYHGYTELCNVAKMTTFCVYTYTYINI